MLKKFNRVQWLFCLLLIFSVRTQAHTFQLITLTHFNGTNGSNPLALTIGMDGLLYGTTSKGGSDDSGLAFSMTTNGILTTLADFATNSGANPCGGLSMGNDGAFYGATENGGSYTGGSIFKLGVDGSLSTLASFPLNSLKWPYGKNPEASLVLGPNGIFYGTTLNGGSNNFGAIFGVTTNGSLLSLTGFNDTNGSSPNAPLIFGDDGHMYGTTVLGGISEKGTIFSITTNGSLTKLFEFDGSNGRSPNAGLVLANDGTLYGTTSQGGTYSKGTIFSLATNLTLNTLVNFNTTNGANPGASLTPGNDGFFYGTTSQGGDTNLNNGTGYGTIFRMTTNGDLTVLVSFTGTNGPNPGAFPSTKLTLDNDGNFYGTTSEGGAYNKGTIFKLAVLPPPPLNISLIPDMVVLTWTNASFSLQTAPEVTGIFTNISGSLSPYTSSISGDQQYFRLIGN